MISKGRLCVAECEFMSKVRSLVSNEKGGLFVESEIVLLVMKRGGIQYS